MSAYINHGKTSVKRNCGEKSTITERNRLLHNEKGCFEKSRPFP
jgi:hypothetical protein